MARTSGLALVPEDKRNPLVTTTYGLGEAILHAIEAGYRRFIVGIGGSATNDAGAGMAQALGIGLLDSSGNNLPFGGRGASWIEFNRHVRGKCTDGGVRVPRSLRCQQPTNGATGASAIYGPQKGATPEMIESLDAALAHFAEIVARDIGVEISDVAGSGAAGGLGGGLVAFVDGRLRAGVDIVLDTVRFDESLSGCDLVITGEGSMDHSTIYNKAPVGVAARAKKLGIPVVGISGSLGAGFRDVHEHGIDALTSIVSGPMTLEEASERSAELIADATEQAMRLMRVGSGLFRD